MNIDVPTLFYVISIVTFLLAGMLVREWYAKRQRDPELLCWAVGYLLFAAAGLTTNLAGAGDPFVSVAVSNAAFMTGSLLVRHGIRRFCGRKLSPFWFALGPIWIIAYQTIPFFETAIGRILVVSSFTAAIGYANAFDFWKLKPKLQFARELTIVYTLHATFYLTRLVTTVADPSTVTAASNLPFTYGAAILEIAIFAVVVAYLLITITRERTMARMQAISETDYLTGIDNRRAFMEKAAALETRRGVGNGPETALLLADLDHFKAINDRFGHGFGDDILKLFCRITERHLRSGDLFGRLGGEEFALLLASGRTKNAGQIAAQIAHEFAIAAGTVDGRAVNATVSIGISGTKAADVALKLREADAALYRAKNLGRNRVEPDRAEAPATAAGNGQLPIAAE